MLCAVVLFAYPAFLNLRRRMRAASGSVQE
jgi:hypothetical protein